MTESSPRTVPASAATAGSIPQALDAAAAASPDKVFLRGDVETTYARLAEVSTAFATELAGAGIGAGDRVAVACQNGADWLTAFFGIVRLGAIVVTINPLYRDAELMHMLSSTRTKAVISEPNSGDYDLVGFYQNANLPDLRLAVFRGDPGLDLADKPRPTGGREPGAATADGGRGLAVSTFAEFLAGGSAIGRSDQVAPGSAPDQATPGPAPTGPAPQDPAVILFSSGTTGRAKGAVLTHASLLASAAAEVEHFGLTADDVMVGVMPLNHVGGITCTVLSVLLAGGAIEMLPSFHPTKVVDLLVAGRVTAMVGVPTMYIMVLQDPRLAEQTVAGLDRVRLCVVGGSNLEPAVAEAVGRTFPNARLANLYGLSETSGACIISPPCVDVDELARSIGVAIGDFRLSVALPDGGPAGPDQAGEIRVSGGCVMSGYWELPDETAKAITADGWLNTGDIGSIDTRGRVTLLGRSKEMYVRGGYNVYPAEVEGVISKLDGVAMVAVVGASDEKYGHTGRAVVVRTSGSELTAQDVRDHCSAHLAEYKVPDAVVFSDSLPLTPSGKIRKTDLID